MPFAYNIRVMFVIIIIITHSDRALFNLNALVSSLGTIVPSAYGLGHYYKENKHYLDILQIGFDAGDQIHSLNHPDSMTDAVLDLEGESLMYRIDDCMYHCQSLCLYLVNI